MSKQINLNQLLSNMSKIDNLKYRNLNELIEIQHDVFNSFFKTIEVMNEELTLVFENRTDAVNFYMDCHYGKRVLKNVGVYYDLVHDNQLILKPILNILGLIDSRQPGLCEISKNLGINFKLEYRQAITNSQLSLYIQQGQILNPECHIYISEALPHLALGQMSKLIRNEYDFKRLNAKFYLYQKENPYESNRHRTQHVVVA